MTVAAYQIIDDQLPLMSTIDYFYAINNRNSKKISVPFQSHKSGSYANPAMAQGAQWLNLLDLSTVADLAKKSQG